MLKQNDLRLDPIIRQVGCYFLCLGNIVEKETQYYYMASQINEVWDICKDAGAIDDNNNILDPDFVLKQFTLKTGHQRLVIAQVGETLLDKTTFWEWAVKFKNTNYKYIVEMVKTKGTIGTHFKLLSADKALLFDSYSFKKYDSETIPRYIYYSILRK